MILNGPSMVYQHKSPKHIRDTFDTTDWYVDKYLYIHHFDMRH